MFAIMMNNQHDVLSNNICFKSQYINNQHSKHNYPFRRWLLKSLSTFLPRGKTLNSNECPGYDTKPSDGEAPVMKLLEIWSTLLSPLPSSPL